MHFPLHAYLISKIISPWETISRGTLSTLLTKLEKDGFITDADPAEVPFPGERPSRAFQITESGRRRFYQLMMDTSSNSSTYQKLFHIKSQHLEFLSAEDQLYLVTHYIDYARTGITTLQKQIAKFNVDHPVPVVGLPKVQFAETTRDLLEVRLKAKELDLEWALRLLNTVNELNIREKD